MRYAHPGYMIMFVPALVAGPAAAAKMAPDEISAERVAEIAVMLPEQAVGLGRPANDRIAWEALAADPAFAKVIEQAEGILAVPLPEQPDDLYLDFSRTGNRTRWQDVSSQRRSRLGPLTIAECLEDKGRFVPAIEELVRAVCDERTWVMPAHDTRLANFNGETVEIDLASSALGWEVALVHWLLDDALSPEVEQLIDENLRARIFEPYGAMCRGERDYIWWMKGTNNWNAVCLAGVTGAALAYLPSRDERAYFIAAAELLSDYFRQGFTDDGYCSEGVGYWNYGFGNYVLLAETIRQATDEAVDLFASEKAAAAAKFGAEIAIQEHLCPAFADCSTSAQPDATIMQFIDRVYGMGLYEELDTLRRPHGAVSATLLYAFENSATRARVAPTDARSNELRSYFSDAGVLISRPGQAATSELAVAMKGGHNAEQHNHNDVGSYCVVLADQFVLLDPGAETYTARTFSGQRYESKLLNSYGHPVPLIAGKQQDAGGGARATVLTTEFSDVRDTFELDLMAAYSEPELTALTRRFDYSREGAGSLTVTDHVELDSPLSFETALVTRGGINQETDNVLLIHEVDQAIRATIDTGGLPFEIVLEDVHDDSTAAYKATRIGIRLRDPVEQATVTVTIVPADLGGGDGLKNGGFEFGSFAWSIPRDGLAEVTSEASSEGTQSLKVTDTDDARGANIHSVKVTAPGDTPISLAGQVRHIEGSGIGMYVKFYDAEGNMLNESDERGNMPPVGSLEGAAGEWAPFEFTFRTPPEAADMQIWIHSYNGAKVEAFIDDLRFLGL